MSFQFTVIASDDFSNLVIIREQRDFYEKEDAKVGNL